MTKKSATPILDSLIESGDIVVRDDEYVGMAADGVEVAIGYTFHAGIAEKYLERNSTPDKWW